MRAQKILIVSDISEPLKPEEYKEYLKTEEWRTEADVLGALKKLGHEAEIFGLSRDIQELIAKIQEFKPDIVFNLNEAFLHDRKYEPHVASVFELLQIKYTGAGPEALRICKDKGLTKKILAYHRIQVPKFEVARRSRPLRGLKKFAFPAFIKPLELEASEGISQVSFAENEKDAIERVKFINEKLGVDAIVEEYIDGRELYVAVIGNERLVAFPPRELFFKDVPEGEPKFATFRAKWNDDYRKKWGIKNGPAASLPPVVEEKIGETCKKIYRVLQLKGYGRIDLRLKPDGEVVFIEANPNPSLAQEDDFAQAAAKGGVDYPELISRILLLAKG